MNSSGIISNVCRLVLQWQIIFRTPVLNIAVVSNPTLFSNEASEVVKEQKGYPYSKHINFNATNRIQKDLIGRKTCQGPLFQEATQVKFLQKRLVKSMHRLKEGQVLLQCYWKAC